MSDLQFSGLSTGIDTTSIVQGLLAAESTRLTTYQNKLAEQEEKRSVVSELQSKLNAYKSAVNALSDSSQLRSFDAKSSDTDALTVSANSNAFEGSHTVQIKQLATADRWIHSGFKYETSYVGAGTLILSYNDQQMSVQTTGDTTLKDLVDQINKNQDNPGITASILRYDDGTGNQYHLVLSGQDSGSDYQITVDSGFAQVLTADSILQDDTETAGLTTKITDLDDFSGGTPALDFSSLTEIHISGTSSSGTVDATVNLSLTQDFTIQDLIGEIEEAYGDTAKVTFEDGQFKIIAKDPGNNDITLNLEFTNGTDTSTLSFTQTTTGGSNGSVIPSLDPSTFSETQSAQDSLFKVDNYPPDEYDYTDPDNPVLIQENWISRSSNTINDVIAGTTLTLHGSTANDEGGYDTIAVNITRDTETLSEKVNAMIEAYNGVVMFLDEKTSYDEETGTSGTLSREYSLTSVESIFRNSLLLNAIGFTDSDSFLNPKDIGLTLDADGLLELDQNKFDEAIVDDYLGVLSLIGAEKSGSTSGTDAAYVKFYDSSEDTTAGVFNVRILADGTAWIKTEDEDWADAREAEVKDGTIYGSNELDGTNPKYPEYNLQLTVDPSVYQARQLDVTVNIRQGFAGALYDTVADFTKTDGRLNISLDSIEDQIDAMERRIDDEEDRLSAYEERLKARYARLEATLSNIQQQFAGISAL